MTRGHRYLLLGFGWAAGVAAVVVACTADEVDIPSGGRDAGGDASSPATDSGVFFGPDGSSGTDAGDVADGGGGAASIWAFNGYCGAETDASCTAYGACPAPTTGVAETPCVTPFERCLAQAAADSGLSDRIFACEPVGHPIWELNRICSFEECDGGDAATCDAFEGGVAGHDCSTPLDRCILPDQRVFVCQPGGSSIFVFNGYCDAGQGTGACNPDFDACAPSDSGVAGTACATELERCLNGEKIFVCAQH